MIFKLWKIILIEIENWTINKAWSKYKKASFCVCVCMTVELFKKNNGVLFANYILKIFLFPRLYFWYFLSIEEFHFFTPYMLVKLEFFRLYNQLIFQSN